VDLVNNNDDSDNTAIPRGVYFSKVLPNSLFENDQLSNILENHHSFLLDKSLLKTDLESFKNHNINYFQTQEMLQKLIGGFQKDSDDEKARKGRISGFYNVIDFLKLNYGLEVMEFAKGEKLEEKISLISTSSQLLDELYNIYCYLFDKTEYGMYDGTFQLKEKLANIYEYLLKKKEHRYERKENQKNQI
jgi:hypothetical protein